MPIIFTYEVFGRESETLKHKRVALNQRKSQVLARVSSAIGVHDTTNLVKK